MRSEYCFGSLTRNSIMIQNVQVWIGVPRDISMTVGVQFEREKWETERGFHERELKLKERELGAMA